jgi:hypothetical protein
LSLNKNRLASLGSNFTDYKKLVFKDQDALKNAHKSVELKYLRQMNRFATLLLHDAVFENPEKETPARIKLNKLSYDVSATPGSEAGKRCMGG